MHYLKELLHLNCVIQKGMIGKMKREYKMALAEVNQILMYTEQDVVSKIPEKFKSYIKNNMDKNHMIKIDENKSLVEQDIKSETKQILALIYRDYICSKEERLSLILQEQQKRNKLEREKQEKYKIDFEKRNREIKEKNVIQELEPERKSLIEVKEEKWYKTIIKKILKFFERR